MRHVRVGYRGCFTSRITLGPFALSRATFHIFPDTANTFSAAILRSFERSELQWAGFLKFGTLDAGEGGGEWGLVWGGFLLRHDLDFATDKHSLRFRRLFSLQPELGNSDITHVAFLANSSDFEGIAWQPKKSRRQGQVCLYLTYVFSVIQEINPELAGESMVPKN